MKRLYYFDKSDQVFTRTAYHKEF